MTERPPSRRAGGSVAGVGRRSERILAWRYATGGLRRQPEVLATEEPLAVELDGVLVATTMRTPGHDFELAAGFCHGEGLLAGAPVRSCRYCAGASAAETGYNRVRVDTGGRAPTPTPRLQPTTAACGLCGSSTLTELELQWPPVDPAVAPPLHVLAEVPAQVEPAQELYAETGGVHAAAAFDRVGTPLVVREDIGRHNAVDKVVGRLLLDDALPAAGLGLFVSGRGGFELVQKAWAAGFAAFVAVGAPSSLALATARAAGITLAGFARRGELTLYTEPPASSTADASEPRADDA